MVCYALLMTAVTLVSSFMAADTVSHVFTVPPERAAVAFLSFWLGALALSVWDAEWMSAIGFLHCFIFLGSAGRLYFGNYGVQEKDFIRVPLRVFLPIYLLLRVAHMIFS